LLTITIMEVLFSMPCITQESNKLILSPNKLSSVYGQKIDGLCVQNGKSCPQRRFITTK